MTVQFSPSSPLDSVEWLYTRPAFGRTGRVVSENNFAKERRSWVAILLREVLQNGLDARASVEAPVEVRIAERILPDHEASFIDGLLPSAHLTRFKASVPHIKNPLQTVRRFLVLEDFGTTGLTGVTDDPEADGAGQNWNAFWFREGEGSKEHGSGNGGAGQGKITYFSTSRIRTLFAYTVRKGNGSQALYGASSFLRDYEFDGKKYLRDSYWGIQKKVERTVIAVPSEDSGRIQSFRDKFGVVRQANEPGLSLVIPSPQEFTTQDAIEVIIAEFFTPILRGDLVVNIDGTKLDADSIMSLADMKLTDDRARDLHTCTTSGYRSFLKTALENSKLGLVDSIAGVDLLSQLGEGSFTVEALAKLREALENEGQISVRFPISIKPREGHVLASHFDVHLMCPQNLEKVEEAVVRRDLLIGEEPIGGGALRQRARALTLVIDPELSKLLQSAEEATHLRWNTRLPRLREYYISGGDVVSFVRNAAARLLEVLTGGDQKRDFKLLAKFFAAPGTASHTPAKGKKSPKGEKPSIPGDIPPPEPKKIVLKAIEDGCMVLPNPSTAFDATELPVTAKLEFAYEGLDKDAFSEYDPLDFDLKDGNFGLTASNCKVTLCSLNELEFIVTAANFSLKITGFDKNLRLRARLLYKEANDDTAVDTE